MLYKIIMEIFTSKYSLIRFKKNLHNQLHLVTHALHLPISKYCRDFENKLAGKQTESPVINDQSENELYIFLEH